MNCRACTTELIPFFSLGEMPLVNNFLREEEIANEEKYNLAVGFCPKCYLVQLLETVSPSELFVDYIYRSSTSSSFLAHCKELAAYFAERFDLGSDSLVLEIASNDGSFLEQIKALDIQIVGVDPAKNIAEIANKKGIRTMPEFFSYSFAEKLKSQESIQADLIYGANVLAHVPEIIDFVKGVKTILKNGGTAIFEFPYIAGLMENKFDTIYDEHVFYYSLIALQNLFREAGLEIYDVELTPMQGGSLMIFAAHPGQFSVTENMKELKEKEISEGFDRIETYREIERNVGELKKELLSLLKKIKDEGKKIAAYSASAKGNVLLNYFGIGSDILDFIVDKAEFKQGLYTPGTHLMVYPPGKIQEEKPDYLLVLCWNISGEIVKQLSDYHGAGGKFIIPIPNIRVL
jgi:SAM-dependent methyltransferase